MLRSWRFALIATAIVASVSWSAVLLAPAHFRWGRPELPKAQGEALRPDATRQWHVPSVEDYRESVETAFIREPQNTWSNLAFVFMGALILARDRRTLARFLGAALFALGLASGLYHASLLPGWRSFDVAMMGWVVFALGLFGCVTVWPESPIFPWRPTSQRIVSLAGLMLAVLVAAFRNDVKVGGIKPFAVTYMTGAGVAVIFALMTVILVSGMKRTSRQINFPLRIALLGTLTLVAVLCQLGDHPGQLLFRPDALIQAHAVWHVLMAGAAYLAYDTFARLTPAGPGSSPT